MPRSPAPPQATKGELTRQRIIAAAAPVFNQRGFAGASMQDLLDATGLEKGGLYRHFPTKEALAVEAFRFAHEQSSKLRTAHLDELPTAAAKLRAHIDHFVSHPSAIPGGCPLLNTAVEADDTQPALRALAAEAFAAWRTRVTRILSAGKRRGEFFPELKTRAFANTIICTLEGAQMLSRLERTRQPLLDAQASLNELIDLYTSR